MQRSATAVIAIVAGLAFGGTAALAVNQAKPSDAPAQMKMTEDGPVLVSSSGMTLYLVSNENTKAEKFVWRCTTTAPRIMNDQQSGVGERPVMGYEYIKSCIQKSPPFLADASAQPVGDFGIVDRPGIGRQWTYRGFPLYFSSKDRKPGDRFGLGTGGLGGGGGRRGGWQFASLAMDFPSGIRFSRHEDGLILANAEDRPIYTPRAGRQVRMAGLGAADFKPMLAPAIASVKGDWSIIDAGSGVKQFAFKGQALYSPPASMNDFEVAASGEWDRVVVYKSPRRPEGIDKQMSLAGEVFADKAGRTLYHYSCNAAGGAGGPAVMGVACDDAGDPANYMVALCGSSQQCAERWRPYIASANAKPAGDWSVVEITYPMFLEPRGQLYPANAPHVKVWAYRGKPVFTYYEDLKPGDIWGDGTKGLWGSNFSSVQVPGRSASME